MPENDTITEQRQWPVFICYRRDDGSDVALWLYENLHGRRVPTADSTHALVEAYFDQATPAIDDWTRLHRPALERARAFLLVCSAGAKTNLGKDDWVHRELRWWIENRQSAPIVIDPYDAGERWIPDEVVAKWPNAQRIVVKPVEWSHLPRGTSEPIEESALVRILAGLRESEHATTFEDLERERKRGALLKQQGIRLRRLLRISLTLLVIVALLAAFAAYQTMIARESTQLAQRARDNAIQAFQTSDLRRIVGLVSQEILEGGRETALLLALHALQHPSVDEVPEVEKMVWAALKTDPPYAMYAHNDKIWDVTVNSKSTHLLTVGGGVAKLWDLAAATETKSFNIGDKSQVPLGGFVSPTVFHLTAVFHPSGDSLVVSTEQKTIVWNIRSQSIELELPGRHENLFFDKAGNIITTKLTANKAVFLRNGEEFDSIDVVDVGDCYDGRFYITFDLLNVVLSCHGQTRVVNLSTGAELMSTRGDIPRLSPDSKRLLVHRYDSEDSNSIMVIFEISSGQELHKFEYADVAEFSRDGSNLAISHGRNKVSIVDLNAENQVKVLNTRSDMGLDFSPDGNLLATSSYDKWVTVWDIRGDPTEIQRVKTDEVVSHFDFLQNNQWVALGGGETAGLWAVTKRVNLLEYVVKHDDWIRHFTLSRDGKLLATASRDDSAAIWETETYSKLFDLPHSTDVTSVAFNDSASLLATSTYDHELNVWDTNDGRLVHGFKIDHEYVRHSAFDSTGNIVFAGYGAYGIPGGGVVGWDLETGDVVFEVKHEKRVNRLEVAGNASFIATASDDGSCIAWDLATSNVIVRHAEADEITDVSISPDGRWIACGTGDGKIRVIDISTKETRYILYHDREVNRLQFDRTGTMLLSASDDNTARLWDFQSGSLLQTFDHRNIVDGAYFNHDDSKIVTFSAHGLAKIWDVRTGILLLTHTVGQKIGLAQFTSDGKQVLTSVQNLWGGEGWLGVWQSDPNVAENWLPLNRTCLLEAEAKRFLVESDSPCIPRPD